MAAKLLPEDLVAEILVRLPVKCLTRFKCVSPSWNSLLRSRTFVTRHFLWHRHDERLMIFHQPCEYDEVLKDYHWNYRLKLLIDDPSKPPQDVEWPFPGMESSMNIMPYGHCNGVFLLHVVYRDDRHKLILWNPATREVKVVPPPHHCSSRDEFFILKRPEENDHFIWIIHGLGVDPKTNDYKIVSLLLVDSLHSVEVYDLCTNSWTIINDTVPASPYYNPGLVINGVFHWLSGQPEWNILCFDLNNNQFRTLKLPTTPHFPRDSIDKANDSLAYLVQRDHFEIWTFNQSESGVEGSWTKIFKINSPLPRLFDRRFGLWKDGDEILLAELGDQPLVSYNLDSGRVRQFQINPDGSYCVHMYVESIVPLSV